ncbi:MAG: amidohydrolase [Deltaproteobacteria bacterium]|nr:amidohydrolase [Deltaproteobacteria bacterium]
MSIRLSFALATMFLIACGSTEVETPSLAEEAAPVATVEARSEVADSVYTNGRIYTVNEAQPWAEAVAIKDGRFLVVGSNADIETVTGESTEVIELAGAFAMPGLGDPHMHHSMIMPRRAFCGLPGTFHEPTEQDTLAALEECIANHPKDREWFVAQGFSSPVMSSETLTRETLDRLIPDKPAYIEDESGHNVWFNTPAMEAAGVTQDMEDTPEFFFSRTEDGGLAGVAYEAAMNPFIAAMPPIDTEIKKISYLKLHDEALSKGITAVGDGYVFEPDLQAWQELKLEGRLNQHIVLYLKGNLGTAELTPVETLLQWWNDHDLPGHMGVKIGMGGAIESVSEALVDGYADPKNSARPIIDAETFANYVAQLDEAGFQIKVHAIGDGSVRATLDGYENTIAKNGNNRLRHHIDHASLIHADDFQRIVDLDVACSIWPPLNAQVAYNIKGIKPMLKPETWDRMYDNRARWDAGIRLYNHSDAPAAVLWPWFGMEATITRGFPGKPDVEKMGPQHALTLEETIIAHTINAAWSLRLDAVTGSIEPGKFADMIILNHDLFEIKPTAIHDTSVQKTIFKGRVVYQAE